MTATLLAEWAMGPRLRPRPPANGCVADALGCALHAVGWRRGPEARIFEGKGVKRMPKQKVCLEFEGHIEVEIDCDDPEDSEAWAEALGLAYDRLTDSDIAGAAEFTGHEIVE